VKEHQLATVVFFEKPGCRNNTRQKALLEASGHQVVARNLLTHPWTAETLRPYFGAKPVAEWFNRAAPRIKDGDIVPEQFDEPSALAAMLADPLLIRRPLMDAQGRKGVGFNTDEIRAWIGLAEEAPPTGESCRRTDGKQCDGLGN
jgi:nitrogenase-associated protein